MKKRTYRKITVADMSPHVHNFSPFENKVNKILAWLENWIILSLECGKIQPYDLLPSKSDLACHIGVSEGTFQNVFRLLEDKGYVESKQRIGTYIKRKDNTKSLDKLTSKRELSIEILKKFILENKYKTNDKLTSLRQISAMTGISNATLRTAMSNLVLNGYLKKEGRDFIVIDLNFSIEKVEQKTLVEKIAEEIKNHIETNLQPGDRLPTNNVLAKMYDVSIKTIHDALKILSKEGLIYSKRGQYGTYIAPQEEDTNTKNNYMYEQLAQKIRTYIKENCQIGDKLPSTRELSKIYNVSEKTVKRALDELFEDSYITFSRGRYGGTFVTDIPQNVQEAYKWLAINTDYIQN